MSTQAQPLFKYADSMVNLAKEFFAIQSKSLSKFNALQKDAVVAWCDTSAAQLGTVGAPDSYQKWLEAQTKLFGEQGAKAQKFGADYLKLVEEGHTDLTAWLQRSTETFAQSAGDIFKPTAA